MSESRTLTYCRRVFFCDVTCVGPQCILSELTKFVQEKDKINTELVESLAKNLIDSLGKIEQESTRNMESLTLNAVNMNTEQLVNSINITEGPVTNMSLAISTNTRTPYSDATKVGRL